jgi:hypothetical protein
VSGAGNVALFAALVALGLLAANNVFGDAAEVVERARVVACGNTVCSPELVSTQRGPIHQRLRFDIEGKGSEDVVCQRTFWLVGAHQCFLVHLDDRSGSDFRF